MNPTPTLAWPLTVTTTEPVVEPAGTATVMLVAVQLAGVAEVPLNATVLLFCEAPKLEPAIVTVCPTLPDDGVKELIVGTAVTVNVAPALGCAFTVITTGPVVAPAGTGAVTLVCDQAVGVAVTPLNATELLPCVTPKFVPVTVTVCPTTPELGVSDVIVGGGTTVNVTPPLGCPFTVTIVGPVVAPVGTGAVMLVDDHAVGVAVAPLNVTPLLPCVVPKFVPAIVTAWPTIPRVGVSDVIVGGWGKGATTVESKLPPSTPSTSSSTTEL